MSDSKSNTACNGPASLGPESVVHLPVTEGARSQLEDLRGLLGDALREAFDEARKRGLPLVGLVISGALVDCGGGFGFVGRAATARDFWMATEFREWFYAQLLDRAMIDLHSEGRAS